MSTFVQSWNKKHKELRRLFSDPDRHREAISLFLEQHRTLHSARLSADEEGENAAYSLEDELFKGMTDDQFRRIPHGEEHSVAWTIWHITRIEDVAMNLLVAGRPQVMDHGDWYGKIGVEYYHTGNAMELKDIARLSEAVDINTLRGYRLAVGAATREMTNELKPGDFKKKVDPSRLEQVLVQGAVVEEAHGIVDYWGKRTIAELLLMPATRHNLVHLNEALRLKQRKV